MSQYTKRALTYPQFLEYEKTGVNFDFFPKEAAENILQKASEDERREWYAERFLCLLDPLLLGTGLYIEHPNEPDLPAEYTPILDMDFQETPHRLLFDQFLQMRPGEHLVFGDLAHEFKKHMILWPRGLFKTSAIIVATVQAILNYPDIRICFLTGGNGLAKRQLSRIKRVFEKPTKRFKTLFPEFCLKSVQNKKTGKWNDVSAKLGTAYEFTTPCRTKDIFAEPTFSISTAKSVKAGSHYDLILIDDLVNETNYRSIKLLEKIYQDYLDITPLLDPSGFILMTGTRYSYGDTYERIQDNAKEENKKTGKTIWQFSIRDCWDYRCSNCGHMKSQHAFNINIVQPPCTEHACACIGFKSDEIKTVLFPETRTRDGRSIGHSLEFLEGEKIRVGDEFFANQYENNPIATGTQTFTEALIAAQTLFHEVQLPVYSNSFTFVVGDLAYVGQEDRDFSVLFVCRKFQGQIFIIDCEFGHWDSAAIADQTARILIKHRPAALFYERFNGWEAYNTIISAVAQSRGIQRVPIEWRKLSNSKKAKLSRIGSVKGPLQTRRLWIYASIKGYDVLVKQLCKWPKLGRNDDFADCAGMVVEAPTGYELETPPAPASTTNWLRKLNPSESASDSYYDNGCGTGLCS